jgi:hypothetical protein
MTVPEINGSVTARNARAISAIEPILRKRFRMRLDECSWRDLAESALGLLVLKSLVFNETLGVFASSTNVKPIRTAATARSCSIKMLPPFLK